jgi:hypothetical protein
VGYSACIRVSRRWRYIRDRKEGVGIDGRRVIGQDIFEIVDRRDNTADCGSETLKSIQLPP